MLVFLLLLPSLRSQTPPIGDDNDMWALVGGISTISNHSTQIIWQSIIEHWNDHCDDHCKVTPVMGVSDQCYNASMQYIHGECKPTSLLKSSNDLAQAQRTELILTHSLQLFKFHLLLFGTKDLPLSQWPPPPHQRPSHHQGWPYLTPRDLPGGTVGFADARFIRTAALLPGNAHSKR